MSDIKIIFFTKYTYAGASSRYRVYQYLPYFKSKNIKCKVVPLFDDDYIELLNKGKRRYLSVSFSYLRRFFLLFTVYHYNIIYIEYELFPFFPALFEKVLKFLGCKIISDYDDAIFHNYDANKSWLVRVLLGDKIKSVMRLSDIVICGNPYLTRYAKSVNENTFEIPTCVCFNKYKNQNGKKTSTDRFIIGWIGSKTTSKNILLIANSLKEFSVEYDCEIRLIGFDESLVHKLSLSNLKVIKWDSDNEVENIQEFSVGIMPLEDKLFEKGKCGFKLIQYMACGIPTISTPFEANVKINRENNNLFAVNNIGWLKCLKFVYENPELFKNVGDENKRIVEQYYSVENNYKNYLDIFRKIF